MTTLPIHIDATDRPPVLDLDLAHTRQRWCLLAQSSPRTAHLELATWVNRVRDALPPWRSERLVSAAVGGLDAGLRAVEREAFG